MNGNRLDALSRALAVPTVPRRWVLGTLVAGLVGSVGSPLGVQPVAAERNTGDPCSKRRKCCCGNVCRNSRCCVPPGLFCSVDEHCCSGACDEEGTNECLCPVTLETVCGGKCCNPLTQVCHNDRCCKLDGVRCDRDGQCCSGDCKNGRCQGACPSDEPIFCPATAESPDGFCCSSSLSPCETFVSCRSDQPPGSGGHDACVYELTC